MNEEILTIESRDMTAVVIDTDASRRAKLGAALDRRGYTVTLCDADVAGLISGVAALESKPDLVLIGSRVPGSEGARVASILRRMWPKVQILMESQPVGIEIAQTERSAIAL